MIWSFYSLADGLFIGRRFSGPSLNDLRVNTPEGCVALEGEHDHTRSRVDLATGGVVPYRSPPPADTEDWTHLWDEEAGAYAATPTAVRLGKDARARRDALLSSCDWVAARASETGEPIPTSWRSYRAALRDVPRQADFPLAIAWPDRPSP